MLVEKEVLAENFHSKPPPNVARINAEENPGHPGKVDRHGCAR